MKKIIMVAVVIAIGAGVYFLVAPRLTRPEGKMNIVYEGGPQPWGGNTPGTARGGSKLDNIYAKSDLSFYNKPEALAAPAKEIIAELNRIGLTREELITSVSSLLGYIDDDLRSKNMVTNYIASMGFKLTGDEFVKLLSAAAIGDDFYYSSVIKSSAEYIQYPLSPEQLDGILAPLADQDYRSKCANMLDRAQMRQDSSL